MDCRYRNCSDPINGLQALNEASKDAEKLARNLQVLYQGIAEAKTRETRIQTLLFN